MPIIQWSSQSGSTFGRSSTHNRRISLVTSSPTAGHSCRHQLQIWRHRQRVIHHTKLIYRAPLNSPLSSAPSHPFKPWSTSQPYQARSFPPHSEAAVDGHGLEIASPLTLHPFNTRPTPYPHFVRCNILPVRIWCTMPHRFESYDTGGGKKRGRHRLSSMPIA